VTPFDPLKPGGLTQSSGQQADYAIYMLDIDGRVVSWNAGAERLKGYARDEIEGRSFGRFFTAEDQASGLPQRILDQARADGRVEAEGWRVRKDGAQFWASTTTEVIQGEDGALIGYIKVTRDLTERHAAQEALIDSERRFRLLVEGVVDYAIYMLDVDGTVTNWNRGAERSKGYKAEEIVGRHFSLFYTPEDARDGLPARALDKALAEGRFEAEGWRVRKDGDWFWASVVIDPIHDDDGRHIGFAKITRDITERRNAQIELQRAHEHLAQSQKMEAMGQLTGGVAHDFNNLLMVVSGQAQLLRGKVGDDPRCLRALDAIDASTRRGQDLTRHLLAFARRQRLRPAPISLAERADGLRELIGASLTAPIALTVDLPAELWPVEIDASELELALLNLAVNARDAMPSGGALSITGRNLTLAEGRGEGDLNGDFVALAVRDTGEGIPPDVLARVFDPFFTTKAMGKGTGLGLSQVYGFAQQSGGRAVIDSQLGEGTGITLYLPRTQARPDTAPAEENVAAPQGIYILVVEDNPDVAEVAAGLLEQMGNRIRVVGSGDAALEAITAGDRPDLVFSDIVMAGRIDGLALARQLRADYPHLRVLLATGYSKAAEQMGSEFPILSKPYQMADLSRAIGAVMKDGPAPAEGQLASV
jgi:PAS domain S-box-containing protein